MELPKPPIGHACNGCGICCKTVVCYNGAFVQKLVSQLGETVPGPCPALTQRKDGSYACGIVLTPNKYLKHRPYPEEVLRRNFKILIGADTGCDELCNNEDAAEELKLMQIIEEIKNEPEWNRKVKIALKVVHGIE